MAELVALSVLVDTGNLHVAAGLGRFIVSWGSIGVRTLLLGCFLSFTFACFQGSYDWINSVNADGYRVSRRALIAHVCALAGLSTASLRLFDSRTSEASAPILVILCLLSGVATAVFGALVFIPGTFWKRLLKLSPPLLLPCGLLAAAGILWLSKAAHVIWAPWMRLTFALAGTMLKIVRPDIVADASTFILGTNNFSVEISPACSGYEGMALMLMFSSAWLWFFRKEFQFPQALLLVPAGMIAMWILNAVRIVSLILIGDAGAPAVAVGGFHSQAGWIAFLGMALAFSLMSQRVGWVARPKPNIDAVSRLDDQTAAYLIPFLAILAAGIISAAATGNFEWGYGLRVVAASAAIWHYRTVYSRLNWRIGWEAPVAGVMVFVVWLAADSWFAPHHMQVRQPAALSSVSLAARLIWIFVRVAGAVLIAPIAEELAFRGYILRRMVSANFTAVSLSEFSIVPFLASSLLFGMLHGRRWIAGAIAGMVYAAIVRRRGSMGEAVVAHSTTNALLAAWVLWTGNWSFW